MSQDQISYMLAQIEKMSNQLDRVREDVGEIKIDMAVRGEQLSSLLEDRKIFKKKMAGLLSGLTAIVVAVGGYIANKLRGEA